MITVKGIYENGKIELLQTVNSDKKQTVLVIFLEDEEDDATRNFSIQHKMLK